MIGTFPRINADDRRWQEVLQNKSIQKYIAEVLDASSQINACGVMTQGIAQAVASRGAANVDHGEASS